MEQIPRHRGAVPPPVAAESRSLERRPSPEEAPGCATGSSARSEEGGGAPTTRVLRRVVATPRRAGPESSRERLTAMIEGLREEREDARPAGRQEPALMRFAPSRRALRGLLVVVVLAVLAGIVFLPRPEQDGAPISVLVSGTPAPWTGSEGPAGPGAEESASPTEAEVVVHVVGAVRRPGLVRLPAGALTQAAVDAAGGPTEEAGLEGINLAAPVESGQQLRIPTLEEAARARSSVAAPSEASEGPQAASGEGSVGPSGASSASPGQGGLINLNTATSEQLEALPRVGPKLAQRILDYRQAHGSFASVAELDAVPGIGEAMMAALEPLVTV